MKIKTGKEFASTVTIISIIISLFIVLVSIFIEFMIRAEISYSFSGILSIYKNNPVQIVILIFCILLPLTVTFLTKIIIDNLLSSEQQIGEINKRNREITAFSKRLINNDFTSKIEIIDDDDSLGKSLLDLRNTLKQDREEELKRRKEDERRHWVAEGLAKFGDILRNNTDNMESLAFNVIKELSHYINAIQGSFYLLNVENGQKYFEQKALFAYDRKKFADAKIKWGVGLIGTCAQEGKTIYMTNIPPSYVNITSGLGKVNPKSILVVPLKNESEIHGVIEIASLNEVEKYQINFVERVAENAASTISSVKINEKTSTLLRETKEQAQTLAEQEEEMRQNMEELQSTQEELARQANKFIKLENTVNHTMIRAEYDVEGILIYANTKFLFKLEYESNSDVEGKSIMMFIGEKDKEWFSQIWENLSKGGRHFEGYMKHVTKSGKDLWTTATYTCIRNEEDIVERILFLALDTTEQKKLSLTIEGLMDAVNRSAIMIEFDSTGNIQDYNDSFVDAFNYNKNEISNLTVFDLISNIEIDSFNNKWDSVIKGIGFQAQFQVKTKEQEEKWIRGGFSAVYDMYGEVYRVVFVGNDVTNEKMMEIELRDQTDTLKKQEIMLRESEKELNKKLREAKTEMQFQYKEIEKIKIRNEKTLEGALDAIITTQHDNKILFFNKAAEELWGFKKEDVMEKDIGVLFSDKQIEEDVFISKYTGPGDKKIIGSRKEVKITTKEGEEKHVLILLSKAQIENEITYTAFIQNIEIELF